MSATFSFMLSDFWNVLILKIGHSAKKKVRVWVATWRACDVMQAAVPAAGGRPGPLRGARAAATRRGRAGTGAARCRSPRPEPPVGEPPAGGTPPLWLETAVTCPGGQGASPGCGRPSQRLQGRVQPASQGPGPRHSWEGPPGRSVCPLFRGPPLLVSLRTLSLELGHLGMQDDLLRSLT